MSTLSTILAVVLGVVFLAAGITKLTRQQQMADNFERWGYASSVMLATGAAVLLLVGIAVNALAITGGLLVMFVMTGALMTHTRAKDPFSAFVPPFVLFALAVVLLVSMLP
jgi:putative oxidoreductase